MKTASYIFHTFAYYVAWLLCLYLAAHDAGMLGAGIVMAITALQIAWQFYHRLRTQQLFSFAISLTILGSCVDTVLLWSGCMTLAANPCSPYFTAPWMSALWFSFAVTLFTTLHPLFKSTTLMACLAFFGFMMAFALGAKMGAASFPHGYVTCVLIGTIWAVLLPLYLSHYTARHDRGMK